MARKISTEAVITAVRLAEQSTTPSTTGAGYSMLYARTDGAYIVDDEANVTGPLTSFSNPMTTAGDIIYGGALGVPTALTAGSDDDVLTFASGVPTWAAGGAGSGDSTYTAAYASIPAASNDGDLFLPSDGLVLYRDTGAAWASWGPIFPLTAPVYGDFAWINQGTATATTTQGGIVLYTPAVAGDQLRILKKAAPATPYTITAAVLLHLTNANYNTAGICWRQSSDGKAVVFCSDTTSSFALTINKYTNETTYSAAYVSTHPPRFAMSPILYLRITDNGTNRIISFSWDGINFLTLHTVGRTDFLTADEVGFFVNSSNATYPVWMTLLSWKEE